MNFILGVVASSFIRKDDWPDKRMAMDDRYGRSDFARQDRYQDFDHRDRGRYQDDVMMDRRDNSRSIGADRDGQVKGVKFSLCSSMNHNRSASQNLESLTVMFLSLQHFSDRSDRHGRDNRDSWSGGYDKRINPR